MCLTPQTRSGSVGCSVRWEKKRGNPCVGLDGATPGSDVIKFTEHEPSSPVRNGSGRFAPAPSAFRDRYFALLPVGLALLAYYPITANYFHGDDYLYLYRIVNDSFFRYLTKPLGGHLLIARNAVFFLCFKLFGTWAPGYFWLALLTHLLNVWLLFHAISAFTDSRRLACGAAALWGVAPMHEASLGWYSVYGHVMAGSVVCALLYLAARWERREVSGWHGAIAWGAILLVGATSFGVGLGVAIVAPLATALLVRPLQQRRRLVLASLVVAVALPFLYFGSYALHTGGGQNPTLLIVESGLEQIPRLLGFLVRLIAVAVTNLLSGPFGKLWPNPAPYAFAIAAGTVAVLGLAKGDTVSRGRILGCVLLSFACYGTVALGLAARTMFFGLVDTDAPRYQYAGSVGLTVALCVAGRAAWRRPISPLAANLFLGVLLAWVVASATVFAVPVDHHDRSRHGAEVAISAIKDQIARTPPQHDVYITNRLFPPIGMLMLQATELFPGWAGLFVAYFPDNVVDGKRVFFVTDDQKALAAAAGGKRTAGLLIGVEEAEKRGWKPRPLRPTPPPSQKKTRKKRVRQR